jgi:chorismate synthase
VAAGGIAKALLESLGIHIFSHMAVLGGITVDIEDLPRDWKALEERAESNAFRCAGSDDTIAAMKQKVDAALQEGVTLGGEVEVVALNVIPGLGSHAQWDRRLDGHIAQALMSIQAVKSVSIGSGNDGALVSGDAFHDEILAGNDANTVYRPTNRAGGLEGGMTNGMPVIARVVMKPISTMRKALRTVNLESGQEEAAHFERSDVTAVPACGVVAEAMLAVVLAKAVMDKFGRDNLRDIQEAVKAYQTYLTPNPLEHA